MPTPSRGDAISGYLPPFAAGAKAYLANMPYQIISGLAISAGRVEAKTHTLGVAPTLVIVTPLLAGADAAAATTGIIVAESAASARTTTSIYIIGNKNAVKFRAFMML